MVKKVRTNVVWEKEVLELVDKAKIEHSKNIMQKIDRSKFLNLFMKQQLLSKSDRIVDQIINEEKIIEFHTKRKTELQKQLEEIGYR